MKPMVKALLISLVLYSTCQVSAAQQFKEKITKKLSFKNPSSANILIVENINGPISVEGYSGNKILLEAELTLKAKSVGSLERAKEEITLDLIENEDSLTVYIKGPFEFKENRAGRRQYNINHNNIDYSFRFDFTIKVPEAANLLLSTVNQGDIQVSKVSGKLHLFNVNGALIAENVAAEVDARTVNGNIEVSHIKSPVQQSSYKTLNGNVVISYPESLSADLKYKNTNGSFYTDFAISKYLPARIEKNIKTGQKSTAYKIEKNHAIRIGSGGPELYFETMNGDIIVKKFK